MAEVAAVVACHPSFRVGLCMCSTVTSQVGTGIQNSSSVHTGGDKNFMDRRALTCQTDK